MHRQTQEDRIESIQQGRRAQMVQADLEEYLGERQHSILAQLVNAHRAGTATEIQLRSGIAEISALWAIRSEMDRRSRAGLQAQEEEFSSRPA